LIAGSSVQAALTMAPLMIQLLTAGTGFAFQFTFGPCTLNTLTSTLSSDGDPKVQIPFTLPDHDVIAIAAGLDEINFFDYPSTFIGVPLGLRAYSIDASATSYRMQVQREGRTHVVSWVDSTRPTTEDADRLRALFARIVGLIRDRHGLEQIQREGVECR
jgi:hypothetical protein